MLIGVVGKPSVGKSTFFKAATLMDIDIANYPFTTIKPNHGVGHVRVTCVSKEFGVQPNPRVGYVRGDHQRFITVDMIDVAGLVRGAHEGKGMGLAFLNDLNQADALIHVIDVSGSTNEGGEPVPAGSYDPANDIRFLEEELDYWYLDILKKPWEKFSRATAQTNTETFKALHKQFSGLGSTEEMIKRLLKDLGLHEKKLNVWTEQDLFGFASALRKETKPMIIAANKIDVPGAEKNYRRLRAEFPQLSIVPCSAESELALREADKHKLIEYIPGDKEFSVIGSPNEKQQKALDYIKKEILGVFVEGTGVQSVLNNVVFGVLEMIAVWPGGVNKLADKDGNVLPDVFLLKKGSTTLDFAYKIHTDIGKGFIRAIHVPTKRTVGKEFVLSHRDVIEIVADR
jgi:ribosome-binding ATPase